MTIQKKSFVWGIITALVFLAVGLYLGVTNSNHSYTLYGGILGVLAFTFVSCLILDNNFIGEMVMGIFSWGFVRFPGLIFELDLDGIIWFLTVKLIFWILGILIACAFGLLAISLGMVLSIFVYPFAIKASYSEK